MPSPKAMTGVVAHVAPLLKATGFRRFGTTFNRVTEPGLIHVVGFQAGRWGDEFTVNLGVYVREIDELFTSSWNRSVAGVPGVDRGVKEYEGWLRARLGEIPPGGRDLWWEYTNLDAAVADIAARLQADAAPAFDATVSRNAVLAWWRDRERQPFGWQLEPRAPLGAALLMKQSGAVDEAQAVVDAVCVETQGTAFHHVVSVLAEEIGVKPCG
jgi:hypothetical protein